MKAIVVGGGVAGAASAIALARIGAEVTAYEAYADPAGPAGSFVSLAANGLRALEVLGCLQQVQAAGITVARQRMWAGNGKLLGDVARGRPSGGSLHSVTLLRAHLVAALRDQAVRCGARIVTGQRLEAGLPEDVRLAGADLIVGADGIWSSTRRALDPAAPAPVYAGLYSVTGVSDGPGLDPGAWNMIFARHGAFIFLPAPDGTVWWTAQVASPRPPDLASVSLSELMALFGTEEQALAILRGSGGVQSATLHHVLAPVSRCYGDRIVLVGDAAHPVGAGQGASMAIEDAVVLGQQLQRKAGVQSALACYDQSRRDRVGKMAKAAATNREAKIAGPVAARLRNLIMPLVFARFYPRATGWLYDYDPGLLEPASVVSS